jgi:hypothetical protein
MKNPYIEFHEQIDAKIELALSWQRKGFYDFAKLPILEAYGLLDRFEERLDGLENMPYLLVDIFCNPEKFTNATKLTKEFSKASRMNLCWTVEEMEKIRKENAVPSYW